MSVFVCKSLYFWSVFSLIWTEYGETGSISPYSVQMRENTDQKNSEYGHVSRSELLPLENIYITSAWKTLPIAMLPCLTSHTPLQYNFLKIYYLPVRKLSTSLNLNTFNSNCKLQKTTKNNFAISFSIFFEKISRFLEQPKYVILDIIDVLSLH